MLEVERKLPSGERERLLADVVDQLTEMTTLISGLIHLARGEQHTLNRKRCGSISSPPRRWSARGATVPPSPSRPICRSRPCRECRQRSSAQSPICRQTPAEASSRTGDVEVAVRDGALSVRDHGPGIDEEDLPHVFDRFDRVPRGLGRVGPRTCDRADARRPRRGGRRGSGRRRRHSHDSSLERQFLGTS